MIDSNSMQIFVTAKPKSKKPSVMQIDATHFVIAVSEAPTDGKANEAIARALAKHLGVRRSDIVLTRGEKSKEKVFIVTKMGSN